jgi:hypothetical protein
MRRWLWLLVPVCVGVSVSAQARPRDEALSGAFRCAVIADSHQWLDCYYGAAQPVRAALGMPPALPAQLKLASAPPTGGVPRDEAARDDVMSGAASCNRVAGDRPWLDCYYASAAPMRAALGLPGGKQVASRPAPPMDYVPSPRAAAPVPVSAPSGPPPMPKRRDGLLNGMFQDLKPIVKSVPMQSFTLDKSGDFTVTLADGQVWEQNDEDGAHHPAHFGKVGPGTRVTISPDAMGTYTMVVDGQVRMYKVHRIK